MIPRFENIRKNRIIDRVIHMQFTHPTQVVLR